MDVLRVLSNSLELHLFDTLATDQGRALFSLTNWDASGVALLHSQLLNQWLKASWKGIIWIEWACR